MYAEHWFETEVYSSGVEIDYYLGYDLWLFWDETVYSGTNFTSFTAREWYEENKDNLMQHGPPPADFINNFNRPLGEISVWKYSSSDPSSGTDILLNKTSSAPDNATGAKTKLLQEHLNKAFGGTTGYTNQTTDGWYEKTGRVIENLQERYESLQTTVSKGAWDYVFNPALKFLTAPLNAVYTGAKYAGQAENPLMAISKGLEGTFYGLLGGLANVPPPNLQMNYPKEWITASVTEALSANDKKANDYFDKHPVVKAGINLVSDFGIGLLLGGAIKSIKNAITNPAPKVTYVKEAASSTTAYRAINAKDAERLSQGLGLEAKNPVGTWGLDEHLTNGSSKLSWQKDPWISTTSDINIAKGFNANGSNLGVVEIDLSKVSSTQLKGWEIYPRINGELGLPYQYSIWQQETSVFGNIPKEAIRGFVK